MAFVHVFVPLLKSLVKIACHRALCTAVLTLHIEVARLVCVRGLQAVMQRFGLNPTDTDVHRMIADADADADGSMNFEEFLVLIDKETKSGGDDGTTSQLSLTRIIERVRAYKEALDNRDFDALERMTADQGLSLS